MLSFPSWKMLEIIQLSFFLFFFWYLTNAHFPKSFIIFNKKNKHILIYLWFVCSNYSVFTMVFILFVVDQVKIYRRSKTRNRSCSKHEFLLNSADILKNVWKFHNMGKKNWNQIYGSQCGPTNIWLSTFFKIFIFSRRKKLIKVWNSLIASKWWQNIHLWGELSL